MKSYLFMIVPIAIAVILIGFRAQGADYSCHYTYAEHDSSKHEVMLVYNDQGGCGGRQILYLYHIFHVETWREHSSIYHTSGSRCATSILGLRMLLNPEADRAARSNNADCSKTR